VAKPGSTSVAKKNAARIILATIMRRAYRRPVQPDEVARGFRIYEAATAKGDEFAMAVKLAVKAVLISPNFLYRIERDRAAKGSTEAYRASDHELATRLSYFLWSSMPDAELTKAADGGRLTDAASYDAQVRRLMADERAHALTEGFAAVWLQVARLEKARPSQQHFPTLTPTLRQAMYDETTMFIDQLRQKDGSLLDLLDSRYTYVNEELAKHYGLTGVKGSELRLVALKPSDNRGGVIGMGSVLLATSHTFRTSPTMRGKWVLEVLLGMPPPPPPADAGQLMDEAKAQGGAATNFREQLERHVTDTACAGCHRKMDPLGFALENYDGIGAWRDSVEVGGKLPSGENLSSVADLKKVLWSKRDRFIRNLVEQMFIYALGRDLLPTDEMAIRTVVDQLAKDGYRFSSLVLGVARSFPFQYRRNADAFTTD
jgi:hypothetical protein